MASDLCLVDSNLLIRWVQPADPQFEQVTSFVGRLEQSGAVPCYVSQNIGEFWNTLTRPTDRNGYGLTPERADALARIVETRFRLLPDSLAVHIEWRRILLDYRVSGVQVHDARLVAAMHVHGVQQILTFNTRDFQRFDDIEALHPLQNA
jgi:predicted nucleic acid-binding protein